MLHLDLSKKKLTFQFLLLKKEPLFHNQILHTNIKIPLLFKPTQALLKTLKFLPTDPYLNKVTTINHKIANLSIPNLNTY